MLPRATSEDSKKQEETEFRLIDGGQNALHVAALYGQNAIVELLLEKKAPVNEQTSRGNTALIYAVLRRDQDVTQTLLNAKADINLPNFAGHSPLHVACMTTQEFIEANDQLPLESTETVSSTPTDSPKSRLIP